MEDEEFEKFVAKIRSLNFESEEEARVYFD
jgi:hypothetical protein